jgi:hypothetical protein
MPFKIQNYMKNAYENKKHPYTDQCIKTTLSTARNWPTTHWKSIDIHGNVNYTTNDKVWE